MVRTGAIGLAMGLVACSSGGGSSSPPSIYGTWASSDGSSGAGLSLQKDGTYSLMRGNETSATSADMQITMGTFTAAGSTLTFHPTSSSCPGPVPVESATYSFDGPNLDLVIPQGVVALTPDKAGGYQGTIRFGCFDGTGAFTPRAVAPVGN